MTSYQISRLNLLLAVFTIAICGFTSNASAQLPNNVRGFRPYRPKPTVSPYLNLTRNFDDGFSPYHSLVRPQMQSRQRSTQQQQQIRQLQGRLTSTALQQRQAQQQQLQSGQPFRPNVTTGHQVQRATYLHYYPGLQPRR